MDVPSAMISLYFNAPAPSLCVKQPQTPRQPSPVSKPQPNASITDLPARTTQSHESSVALASSSCSDDAPASPTSPNNDGYSTPKSKLEKENQNQTQKVPPPSPMNSTGKRKRLELEDDELTSFISPTTTRRKGSSDFLRKGQWTSTEERLARLLIEAFEEGYLPIYTGIRLRGYLAVQLQCDPMRVSKKLCAGTIDGKVVPKNYGQQKYKLRKKSLWDADEAECRITELELLTKALWVEARMKKPAYLTLSCTRNLSKRREFDGDDDWTSSPSSPAKGRAPSSTPKAKKQKVFPIIYLNLTKLKRYTVRDDSSDSDPAKDSDSDTEPVRLDGESLQAAYDLLTLCSPRGTSKMGKARKKSSKKLAKRSSKKDAVKNEAGIKSEAPTGVNPTEDTSDMDRSTVETTIKDESCYDDCNVETFTVGKLLEDKSIKANSCEAIPTEDTTIEAPFAMDKSSGCILNEACTHDCSSGDASIEAKFDTDAFIQGDNDVFIKIESSSPASSA